MICVHGRTDCLCGRVQPDRIDYERQITKLQAKLEPAKAKLAQRYTLDQVREAFWKTFHLSGEQFFNYLGTDEDNGASTQQRWEDFKENLGT